MQRVEPISWDARSARAYREQGFVGWIPLGDAVAHRHRFLAEHESTLAGPGVYAIFAPSSLQPRFKTGALENVIDPWPPDHLSARGIERGRARVHRLRRRHALLTTHEQAD